MSVAHWRLVVIWFGDCPVNGIILQEITNTVPVRKKITPSTEDVCSCSSTTVSGRVKVTAF